MARTQAEEYWGGAAYFAAGSDHYCHPRACRLVRIEGTGGERLFLPRIADMRGHHITVVNEGPDALEIVNADEDAVLVLVAGYQTYLYPLDQEQWQTGTLRLVR